MQSGSRPSSAQVEIESPATRHYWNLWDSLLMEDGYLYRKFYTKDGTSEYLQLLVPKQIMKDILYHTHDNRMSGHLGCKKTLKKTKQKYYWFEMKQDVQIYVQQCDICAAAKESNKRPKASLGSMLVGAPMDRLATDILGPLPLTPRGNRYILVVGDYFTKWVEIIAVPDQTAETCAQKIVDDVISRLGNPLLLHSDQGRNFESGLFKELCNLLEITKTRTTARNPKCNGFIERMNRSLIRMIRAYLRGEQTDWDRHLNCLAAAYRATPNESTGFSPNLLMLGREVRLSSEIMYGSHNVRGEPLTSYGDYVDGLKAKMQKAHEVCRKHLALTAARRKDRYDAKRHQFKYTRGDAVWGLNEKRLEGVCKWLMMDHGLSSTNSTSRTTEYRRTRAESRWLYTMTNSSHTVD